MSNLLPDLDDSVSFVVDQGSPVGPIPMRSIIDSIRSGERAPDVLVWWAGATDWVSFSKDPGLVELLQELPATNQPPPPPEAPLDESRSAEDPDAGEVFPEPEIRTFDVSLGAIASVEVEDLEQDDVVEDFVDADAVDADEPFFDPVVEAEADALLARDSRSMHPSATWGGDETTVVDRDESVLETRAIDPEAFQRALDEHNMSPDPAEIVAHGDLETTAIDPSVLDDIVEVDALVDVASDDVASDDVVPDEAAETNAEDDETNVAAIDEAAPDFQGLFGAPGRRGPGGSGAGQVELVDATTTSLENVGARIDALTTAARRAQLGESVVVDDADDADDAESVDDVESQTAAGSWQAVDDGHGLDDRFSEMVRRSVEHQRRLDWALRPDELLLSSCITAIVERGFVLLDVENFEDSQRAVFDHNGDSRQLWLELSPLSPVNAAGDPVGRHVQVSVAWGRKVQDADAAFATVRAEASDDVVEPGTISCEVNMVAESATTSVDLIWAADEFVSNDQTVDRSSLDSSLIAILRALEARWYDLFAAAD